MAVQRRSRRRGGHLIELLLLSTANERNLGKECSIVHRLVRRAGEAGLVEGHDELGRGLLQVEMASLRAHGLGCHVYELAPFLLGEATTPTKLGSIGSPLASTPGAADGGLVVVGVKRSRSRA